MPAFPLGGRGAEALGRLGIPHGQQQFQIVLLAPHRDETKQGGRYGHSTKPWMTSESLFRGFSQLDAVA